MSMRLESRIAHVAWLLPVVAGGTWFLTLTILLVHWLVEGRPTYPSQSNPYVAFISDIAAFDFKPVFIVGSTVTAITYFATICRLQYVRHAEKFGTQGETKPQRFISLMAIIASLEATISLLLLTAFDTFRAHERHKIILLSTFGSLGASAILTAVTWSDQLGKRGDAALRKWCIANTILVVVATTLGIAFVMLLYSGWWRTAGFVEWTTTYLGAFWLFTFVGHLRKSPTIEAETGVERRPLLSPE